MLRGHPRSRIGNITIRWSAYDFLFEFNGKYEAISYRFETLSLIFHKLKRSRDNDHAPFKDKLSSVCWDLI